MGLMAVASSIAQNGIAMTDIPDGFRKRSFPISSRALRSAIEHLPSVNTRRLRTDKYIAYSILIPLNLALMYMFKTYAIYRWWLFPFTLLRLVVDAIEITAILIFYPIRFFQPRLPQIPIEPENFVYLLCCYNETYPELMISLDSLAAQRSLDDHKKAIIVVCDGRVSSKGMTKTAAAHLTEDIIERPTRITMSSAYTSWDGAPMDIELVKGEFKGLPIICLIKNENRGKRDGIILMRSFLHKFNQRKSNPSLAMFNPRLFTQLSHFLESVSIQSVNYVVGIDADTRFDPQCVTNLIQTVREGDKVIGVTGCVVPDPTTSSPFSPAFLYQNAEYIVGQHRRRLRQSLTSGRVTCLPGCCQLLRVEESTCGDDILGKFGYYPKETDGLFRTIQSMMAEDRDHICLVLSENPDVQTRACLKAIAYTTVPNTPLVFLSQRRRWTLGPLTSDALLISRKSTGYIERLAAFTSVLNWLVNPALFISRYYRIVDSQTAFLTLFLEYYRVIWDLAVIMFFASSPKEAIQQAIGLYIYGRFTSVVNFITQLYTLYNLDNFRWGKTRVAVSLKQSITSTGA